MHASVALAALGIPSVAICTDTRLLMVAELGLPTFYVKDVNENILEQEIEKGAKTLRTEQERLLALQRETWQSYISLIEKTLS
jgi:hypothetical protein